MLSHWTCCEWGMREKREDQRDCACARARVCVCVCVYVCVSSVKAKKQKETKREEEKTYRLVISFLRIVNNTSI